MTQSLEEIDMSMWFSTYGLLTSQRILERFKIHLNNEELASATKNPRSMYFQLLRIPLKNVFNGIILQQAHDYQVYAQKLFVDYLLSGEGNKEATSPGANTREDLEQARGQLMQMGEDFHKIEVAHQTLIADSQASLIKLSAELQQSLQSVANTIKHILLSQQIMKDEKLIQQAIRGAMIHFETMDEKALAPSSLFWKKMSEILSVDLNNDLCQKLGSTLSTLGDPRLDIEAILSTYLEQAETLDINLCSYRRQFYDIILKTVELINLLPDNPIDKEKDEENRSTLHFDAHIGEE